MADHSAHGGSDTGAAFAGLIGGAVFIGVILYAIVVWTNKKFEGHAAEKGHASVPAAVVAPLA